MSSKVFKVYPAGQVYAHLCFSRWPVGLKVEMPKPKIGVLAHSVLEAVRKTLFSEIPLIHLTNHPSAMLRGGTNGKECRAYEKALFSSVSDSGDLGFYSATVDGWQCHFELAAEC
ncbi:MAG: hypothetical protein R6X05_14380 [Desulfobacterales bacterium]